MFILDNSPHPDFVTTKDLQRSTIVLEERACKSNPLEEIDMAQAAVAHFQNDQGVETIKIGVKTFMCCGASEPYDHPHVFLDMGSDNEIVCPYCSTKFQYSSDLSGSQSLPEGCEFVSKG